ncbi:hypothetical protein [Shewanella sp. ALD9]|jgi:hypothetical protein|uniref:hypothetical protein n=1 Tax=Shewanella sp. ALD9 TaxID=2058330 RepID=UPI000C341C8B|nr:hypothetical protein [Shewanella sp. ALD9]PKH34542.1 hypothetical protein CXF88_01705 [Shewanella sp. ALD9]|tara:strand:+ start:193 stop:720 length:528 start_codon:yes stop_codon:yes gene_type:complete
MGIEKILEISLEYINALVWPGVLLVIIFSFKKQVENLFVRVKTSEIAGAKFSFTEVASGMISSKVDAIADETDPKLRAKLAVEVKSVAAILGAIHPITLSLLIGGAGGNAWSKSIYQSERNYFDQLEEGKLAKVIKEGEDKGEDSLGFVKLELLHKGEELLSSIGFYDKLQGNSQ